MDPSIIVSILVLLSILTKGLYRALLAGFRMRSRRSSSVRCVPISCGPFPGARSLLPWQKPQVEENNAWTSMVDSPDGLVAGCVIAAMALNATLRPASHGHV